MSIARGSIHNLIGAAAPGIVSLVTVPLYLHVIGAARYGVLAVVWVLLGYFGLFDLGLSRATANRIAQLHAASSEQRQEVFWTACLLNAALGVLGGAILYVAGQHLLRQWVSVSEALRAEALAALPWMALAVPLATVSGVLTGTLEGRERFGILNVIQASGTIAFQTMPLLAAFVFGPQLRIIVGVAVAVRAMSVVPLVLAVQSILPITALPHVHRARIRELFAFGLWVTVTNVISPILSTIDRLLIGALMGARAVTYYAVPANLVNRIQIVPGALERALFPRFSKISAAESSRIRVESLSTLAAITTPLTIVGLLGIRPFLYLWIGPVLARQAAPVGEILLTGMWVNGLAYLPLAQLQAQGKPAVVAKFHLLEVPPFLLLVWFGVRYFGIIGAAVAWTLRVWADACLLFWATHDGSRGVRALIPGAALVAGSWLCAHLATRPFTEMRFYAGVPLLILACAWSLTTSSHLRNGLWMVVTRALGSPHGE